MGVLAGGLSDGTVQLFDPNVMVSGAALAFSRRPDRLVNSESAWTAMTAPTSPVAAMGVKA